MQELEALLDKFWSDTISQDELKQLETLLQQQQSGNGASALMMQGAAGEDVRSTLDPEKADELFKSIHTVISNAGVAKSTSALKKKIVTPWLRLAGIAAGIMIAVIFTWLWTRKDEVVQMKNSIQMASSKVLHHTENKTDTIMKISLPDGSAVMLYPGSEISYYFPFINNKRDITLRGAGEFNVAGDRSKPFTVYANDIATTALGTRFKVDAEEKQVHVLLYEGRVVVQPASGNSNSKKAYLYPGQQLAVTNDFDYNITGIQSAAKLAAATKGKKVPHKNDLPAESADTANLSFRNTPLSDVFDNLANKFHVHIICADRDKLQQIPFTGHFNGNDSLENLLKVLCGMNNLQYQLAGDEVTISHP
jgi:ferric-dicitrate binding protein FerR (iron transport regulator)